MRKDREDMLFSPIDVTRNPLRSTISQGVTHTLFVDGKVLTPSRPHEEPIQYSELLQNRVSILPFQDSTISKESLENIERFLTYMAHRSPNERIQVTKQLDWDEMLLYARIHLPEWEGKTRRWLHNDKEFGGSYYSNRMRNLAKRSAGTDKDALYELYDEAFYFTKDTIRIPTDIRLSPSQKEDGTSRRSMRVWYNFGFGSRRFDSNFERILAQAMVTMGLENDWVEGHNLHVLTNLKTRESIDFLTHGVLIEAHKYNRKRTQEQAAAKKRNSVINSQHADVGYHFVGSYRDFFDNVMTDYRIRDSLLKEYQNLSWYEYDTLIKQSRGEVEAYDEWIAGIKRAEEQEKIDINSTDINEESESIYQTEGVFEEEEYPHNIDPKCDVD